MNDKMAFVKLPALLLLLFFIGKLIVGMTGGSYELGTRLFAMVPLTVTACVFWGAVGKAFKGYGVTDVLITGVLIALVAQILIVVGTLGSYLLGVETHFNHPVAIVGVDRVVGFGEAVGARLGGLVVNSIMGAIAALIGFALGGLVGKRYAH
jgi:hypothetical protein